MIVIPGLLLIFGVNYGIFLIIKPMFPQHFTFRVMGKVSAPITRLNKPYMPTFIKKPPLAWLDALIFTEFEINSIISQRTGYLPFFH